MSRRSERIVLITGGSSGIGFEMAKQMADQGATVIICGRSQEKLEEAKRKVPQLQTIRADITCLEDRETLYARIAGQFRGFNLLVNNAGIVKRYLFTEVQDLEESLVEEWQTNYMAPILLIKRFLPMLIENQGTIVNVTSGLAYTPLYIQPNYCAAKAALHSITQSMRVQFSKRGVKVVEIFYPAVNTPFQNGHAPSHAIQPQEAAAIALRELNRGKDEIRIKGVGPIYLLSRLTPAWALKLMNGFGAGNVEERPAFE